MEIVLSIICLAVGIAFGLLIAMAFSPKEAEFWKLREENDKLRAQNKIYENQSAEQIKIDKTAVEYNQSLLIAIAGKTKQKLKLEREILQAQTELNVLNELLAERKKEFFGEVPSKGGDLEDNSKN